MSFQRAYGIGFLWTAGILGFTFLLKLRHTFLSCGWCVLQQELLLTVSLLFLLGAVHRPNKGFLFYQCMIFFVALLGFGLAGYHALTLYAVHHPAYAVPGFPDALEYACLLPQWRFLTLSLPTWSALTFMSALIYVAVLQMSIPKHERKN